MTPSARVEIANRGGFRSGILYNELRPLIEDLYGQGKTAVAYHVGSSIIVGRSEPADGICWARDHPPIMGIAGTLSPQSARSS